MNREEIKSQCIEIIADEAMLSQTEVRSLSSFDGVIDSLSFIVIITNIEAGLGISIPKSRLKELTTLESTVDVVTELKNGATIEAI